jgi:hypothetical protein
MAILRTECGSVESLKGTRRSFWRLRTDISSQRGRFAREHAIAVTLVTIVAFTLSPMAWSQANPPSEYELKAAFLFNFAKFIDWPRNSFTGSQSSFTICVLGQDPFGHILDGELQGKMIGDRHLSLERLKDKTGARHCEIVFISSSESAHLPEILESLRGASVLLVGETSGFASSGGTIEFTLEDNRVRFMINTDTVDRTGLAFSSKLLSLAKLVHDEGHSNGG